MKILRAVSATIIAVGLLVILGTAGALDYNMSMTLNQAISQITRGQVLVVIGAIGMAVSYK